MEKGLDINLVPYKVALQCLVQFFQRSQWTTSLIQSCFDLVISRAGINDFISMMCKAHTSKFLTTSI
jgi:hypothetical protein